MTTYLDDLYDALDMRDDVYEELKFIVKQEKYVLSIIGKFIFGCIIGFGLFAIYQVLFGNAFAVDNKTLNMLIKIFIISIVFFYIYGGYRIYERLSLIYDKVINHKFKWKVGTVTDKRQSFIRHQYKDNTKHDRHKTVTYTEKTIYVDDEPCNIINPFDFSRSKVGDTIVMIYLGRYNYAIRLKTYLNN